MKYIKYYFISIIILLFLSSSSISKLSNITKKTVTQPVIEQLKLNNNKNFIWPTPGYNRITSKFGKRNSPTKGASSSHSGIDIAAPTGSNILSILSGTVTYTGFKGAGGFTVTVKNNDYQVSYCHVSPDFIVSVGDFISQGSIISKVGPYNVYNVPNNPYKDSKGRPTNGASTGAHLHLTIRQNGFLIDPLQVFTKK